MRPADVNGHPPLIHISATLTMSLSGDADGSWPACQFALGGRGRDGGVSEVHYLLGWDSPQALCEYWNDKNYKFHINKWCCIFSNVQRGNIPSCRRLIVSSCFLQCDVRLHANGCRPVRCGGTSVPSNQTHISIHLPSFLSLWRCSSPEHLSPATETTVAAETQAQNTHSGLGMSSPSKSSGPHLGVCWQRRNKYLLYLFPLVELDKTAAMETWLLEWPDREHTATNNTQNNSNYKPLKWKWTVQRINSRSDDLSIMWGKLQFKDCRKDL